MIRPADAFAFNLVAIADPIGIENECEVVGTVAGPDAATGKEYSPIGKLGMA